jgi:hypothetical protein
MSHARHLSILDCRFCRPGLELIGFLPPFPFLYTQRASCAAAGGSALLSYLTTKSMCSSPASALYLACSSFIAAMKSACLATTTCSGIGSGICSTGMGRPTATNIGLGSGSGDLRTHRAPGLGGERARAEAGRTTTDTKGHLRGAGGCHRQEQRVVKLCSRIAALSRARTIWTIGNAWVDLSPHNDWVCLFSLLTPRCPRRQWGRT